MASSFEKIRIDQRGLSLLEVLLSTVVLGIALTGFLMALSTATTTSKIASDESKIVYYASLEFEELRATPFVEIPFVQTSQVGHIEEVPDYFKDIAISQNLGGDCLIVASGDLNTGTKLYSRDYAFDGKRANMNSRWMGAHNMLAWVPSGGGPIGGGPGGGGGPDAGGPGGGPGAGGDYAPSNFQYIYCAFPRMQKISRILYDNRFNVTELLGAPVGDFDYLPHKNDIWQRRFTFFHVERVLEYGEIYDPWNSPPQPLLFVKDQGYDSSGVWVIFDNYKNPLETGIIGVYGIDTYSDFDAGFHWPYVSEIEVYGFNKATAFFERYISPKGEQQYNNVIMYFPNYLDSGWDMGRRTYVVASSLEEAQSGHNDLIKVEIEFYPASRSNLDINWQRTLWWQRDTDESAKFETSFYRDEPTRIDQLPNLNALPSHVIYDNNEDLTFPFTVPGATSIRIHFSVFDLEPGPGTDEVWVEDENGNIVLGPGSGNDLQNTWTPWVEGDTVKIRFKSNNAKCSYDLGYGGFVVDSVEIGSVNTEPSE